MTDQPILKSTPRDVFIQLLGIITLYASVISFIALLWQLVNIWLPDPLNFYRASAVSAIRWSGSVLVVMFPVYVFISWLMNRDFTAMPERREIKVRKWLVYFTLFAAALTVIIDVITLIYNLLGGELTAKFLLKVLIVLLTAAAVFAYYYYDLRKGTVKNIKLLAWATSGLVIAAVVAGVLAAGSPQRARLLNFDARRISDLQMIQGQIINHWQQKGALPKNLSELTDTISGFTAPKDPQTGADYDYRIVSDLSFQLCANFNLSLLARLM